MNVSLAECLRQFFGSYLREQRGLSPHTVHSYRDTLKILVRFASHKKGLHGKLSLADLNSPTVLAFLQHLELERKNSILTRNQRLMAIHCFFKFLLREHPAIKRQAERILAIPTKKAHFAAADHLDRQELETLLAQPNLKQADGVRDLALLTLAYNTGARAQEMVDLKVKSVDFERRLVTLTGKGQKSRVTPVWPPTIKLLKLYYARYRRKPRVAFESSFFINQRRCSFTRFGMRRLVKKYLRQAAQKCPSIATKRLSIHSLRHTTAVHLLESNVEVHGIRGWLGHAQVNTTSRYLDLDVKAKRQILERFAPPGYVTGALEPKPGDSPDKLLDWLKDL